MRDERRKSDRLLVLGELRAEVTVFLPTGIADIGSFGAQIETPFQLQLDSLHEFRLMLGDRAVVVQGRIVYSRISDVDEQQVTYRSGVEFVELSPHVRAAITDYIDSIKGNTTESS